MLHGDYASIFDCYCVIAHNSHNTCLSFVASLPGAQSSTQNHVKSSFGTCLHQLVAIRDSQRTHLASLAYRLQPCFCDFSCFPPSPWHLRLGWTVFSHHCLTPALKHAQCNNVALGRRLPIQPSAVGNRSLMWPYHITGTPRCSTPKVDNQHSLG